MPPKGRKSAAKPKAAPPPPPVEDEDLVDPPVDSLEAAPVASTSATPGPSTPFTSFRAAFSQQLDVIARQLKQRRAEGVKGPVEEDQMNALVESAMDAVGRLEASEGDTVDQWRKDFRKTVIDRGLEDMLSDKALYPAEKTEATDEPYGLVSDVLDVILTFSEREYCDANLPLTVIGNLLELQTIAGCQHIFSYVESRVERLTRGMHPQRGKGPILLRLLNELLRRLPKSKQEHVIFSGRILMFLSSVFPLGEKSGVNLRGNFNIGKQTLFEETTVAPKTEDGEDATMDVEDKEEGQTTSDSSDFYQTFWSLQRFFTNPALLVPASPALPSSAEAYPVLRTGLERTLAAFSDATQKEKDLLGAATKEGAAGKQKARAEDDETETLEHYFFPKFLTSKDLLGLELADPAFRRQILVQVLILFQYLLSFTTPARAAALALPTTNAVVLPNYALSPTDEKWILEVRTKVIAELDSMEGGVRFRQAVELVLRREQNWVNWKLRACVPFEKAPLAPEVSEKAKVKYTAASRRQKPYMHKLGNANLSRAWQFNTTSLDSFEAAESGDDFDSLVRQWTMSSRMLKMKQGALKQAQDAKATGKVNELRSELEQLDIKVKSLHWRALRNASARYVHLFPLIKDGDLNLLLEAIEAERQKKEAKLEAIQAGTVDHEKEKAVEKSDGVALKDEGNKKGAVEGQKSPEAVKKEEGQGGDAKEVVPAAGEEKQGATTPIVEPKVATPSSAAGPGTPKRTREEDEDVSMSGDEPEAKKLKQEPVETS